MVGAIRGATSPDRLTDPAADLPAQLGRLRALPGGELHIELGRDRLAARIVQLGDVRLHFTTSFDNLDWIDGTIATQTSYALSPSYTTGDAGNHQYRRETVTARGAGTVVSGTGLCLGRDAGDAITTQRCSGVAGQQWSYTVTGALRTTEATPRCLVNQGGTLGVAACNGSADQTFCTGVDAIHVQAVAMSVQPRRRIGVRGCDRSSDQMWEIVN